MRLELPQTGWARLAVKALLGIIAAILLYRFVLWPIFFARADNAGERGGRIVAEEQVQAGENIAEGTMEAVHERDVYREHITTIVRDGREQVDASWKGETVGDDVDAAGAAALCRVHDSLCRRGTAEEVQPVR